MKKLLKRTALISLCLGILMAIFMINTAWQHNPQCSIHCFEEGTDWRYLLLIGTSWLLPTSCISFFILTSLFVLIQKITRSSLNDKQ